MVLEDTKQGYRVLVRTVSSFIILACIIVGALLFLRVSVVQTYFPKDNPSSDLLWLALLFGIATFFALSFYRAKFVWFWPVNSIKKDA